MNNEETNVPVAPAEVPAVDITPETPAEATPATQTNNPEVPSEATPAQ